MANLVDEFKEAKEKKVMEYTADVEFTPTYVDGVATAIKQNVLDAKKQAKYNNLLQDFANRKAMALGETKVVEKDNEISYEKGSM